MNITSVWTAVSGWLNWQDPDYLTMEDRIARIDDQINHHRREIVRLTQAKVDIMMGNVTEKTNAPT